MNQRPSYRLLTIDLDDTLWPCRLTIQRAEEALYGWLAERAPRLAEAHDHASLREHRRVLARAQPAIAHDLTVVRHASLGTLLAAFGYAPSLADEAMDVFLDHRNRVEPYPEVPPVLRRLAPRYRLVSVTNGNSDVARTPLAGLFHRSLTAAGVGAAKPDPALFEGALDWAGLDATQAVHVGDDPRLDVEAARRIGMQAVWVNRSGQTWPEDLAPPVVEVTDLNGLIGWLEGDGLGL
jgi:putative hydrolase of the HAD superfamily